MSDYYDFSDIYKNKLKRSKLKFPIAYLRNVMKEAFQMFIPQNIQSTMKNSSITLFNRLFGSTSRRQIFDVLVLVADLEANVGAACIELLNYEAPDLLKRFNYRPNFPYFDENPFFDDFLDETYTNHDANMFSYPAIENICNDIQDESIILDANINNEDQLEMQINPEYLMQISLTSAASNATITNIESDLFYEFNENDSSDSIKTFNNLQLDWKSYDTSSFTEASTSDKSFEWGDKENKYSDSESDEEDSDSESIYDPRSLPKPVKREINQLRILGVPYEYQQITQSSHDEFKVMRANPRLTKSQIGSMVNARRRFINRRAATRCRTQKVQQKDHLRVELKKLQDQLVQTRITLAKAYQERNQMKDSYRELQQKFISRLESPHGKALCSKKWSAEFTDDKSLILRENNRS